MLGVIACIVGGKRGEERKDMDTEQESLAEVADLLPLACGMWKAISEITGLSLLLSALCSCSGIT